MNFAVLSLSNIEVMPDQSRQKFDEEALDDLARSIEQLGQLQPVIVRRNKEQGAADDSRYQLIAGERRYRAMKQQEEKGDIAALIVDEEIEPEKIKEINLVENIQREDLDELERAQGIKSYMDRHDLTVKEASLRLGVPRTTLTQWLKILEIKPEYQQAVLDDDCSLGLSHVSRAVSLGSSTGNPVLTEKLIKAVIKYNLTRAEVEKIGRLYNRHLHLEMEEAVGAVLMDRERQQAAADLGDLLEEEKREKPVKELIRAFSRASEKLEDYMEEIGHLEEEESRLLLDEFLYQYQLLQLMLPELEENGLEEMVKKILRRKTG
ncbi:ParB/RepB/Spo0J family partition protein [Halarsenatibacter silvermanii]|uniref:ParB/RepB/Spo0J family partition protein n=1 Tax=Halarsenatibacter silvermanii TaxID=321763 RepID=A0A1G9HDB5_9FIRM|nr:ParB/RepB/Spo0J family partition protein [Halarsenatibacter silvermanii]SDL10852.1 ParB/RepB/Spo0J family partition protein [Halarsenatibacter silvermanii]